MGVKITQTVEVEVKSGGFFNQEDTIETKEIEIPDDYDPVKKKAYNTQYDVTKAFLNKKFPVHNVVQRGDDYMGVIYSSDNFEAHLLASGKGDINHYSTTETIRTYSGLIIVNTQGYSDGFANCSPPSFNERDATLPLTTLYREYKKSIFQIESVEGGDRYHDPELVRYSDGTAVGVVHDETSKQRGAVLFKLDKEEAEEINDPSELESILKPDLVKFESESKDKDVKRQGEWYFIPKPDLDVPDKKIIKRLKICRNSDGEIKRYSEDEYLGSHIPRDMYISADGRVFVRGTVRHIRNEHEMLNLGETWHLAARNRYKNPIVAQPRGGGKAD